MSVWHLHLLLGRECFDDQAHELMASRSEDFVFLFQINYYEKSNIFGQRQHKTKQQNGYEQFCRKKMKWILKKKWSLGCIKSKSSWGLFSDFKFQFQFSFLHQFQKMVVVVVAAAPAVYSSLNIHNMWGETCSKWWFMNS